MNINEVYSIMRFIARKNQLESLSPAEFEYSFNVAQRNYYDFLVGRIEQYRYDKPIPRVGLSMTDNITERLAPFQEYSDFPVSSGLLIKPSDFNKLISMSTPNGYRVYRVEQNRLQERIKDSIDPINEENAFYTEYKSNWSIYPSTLDYVYLSYLKMPKDVAWSYSLDGNGRPIYSQDGVQLLTTGTGANWSGTSFTTGYTHTTGSTATLESALYSIPNKYYSISINCTGTQGSCLFSFGNFSQSVNYGESIGSTYLSGNTASNFKVTPDSNFNGTITVTLKAPSVDPEWKDNDIDELIGRALKVLGVSIKESALINYGQQVITQGE